MAASDLSLSDSLYSKRNSCRIYNALTAYIMSGYKRNIKERRLKLIFFSYEEPSDFTHFPCLVNSEKILICK